MIPLNPLSIEEQKKRIPAMLAKVWDFSGFIKDQENTPRPGRDPDCIFDIAGVGVRLIISRDKKDELQYLHVSASVYNVEEARGQVASGLFAGALSMVEDVIAQLFSDRTLNNLHLFQSEVGVIHWFFDDVTP